MEGKRLPGVRIRTPAKDDGDIGPQGWFGRVPSACSGLHILSNIGSNMGSNIVPTIVFFRMFFPSTVGNGCRTVPWALT